MVKNIVEKAITPYNPSSNKVLNKDKYNLFVPTADVNKPGMAGYNPAHFEVRNQIVSISSLYTASIQKEIADAKSSLNTRIDAETWKVNNFTYHGGDVNDLFTPGSYLCQGDNMPEPNRFVVFVLDIKATYVQYAISMQGQVYTRYARLADKSWSSWEKLTFESTVDAVKGDIQTLSDKLNSIVIGNKQEIYTIVNTLPEEGLTDKIYLVPVIEPDTQNKFDEYLWVNGHWEYFGRSAISIDTSNLVTKQNFLTGYGAPTYKTVAPFIGALYVDLSTGVDTYQCTDILSTGVDFQWVKLLNNINLETVDLPVVSKQDFIVGDKAPTTSTKAPFVGALYLDSAKNNTYQCTAITSEGETTTYTWVKLIRETDYADGWVNAITTRTGIVTVYPQGAGGISVASGEPKGRLAVAKALKMHIDERTPTFYEDANTFGSNYCRPIVPANVDYAHYQVIINPKDRANSSSDKWSWSGNDRLKGMKFYNARKFLLGCNIPLTITSVSNGTYTATIYTQVADGDYLITADNAYLQIASVTANQGQDPSDDYIKPSPNAVTLTTTYTITFTVASGTFTAVANDFFYVAHSNGTKILSAYYTASELEALSETWTFTLDDGQTVTKKVLVLPDTEA